MKNSGFINGMYMVSEWVMRFSVINLLWLFFNLPILFIAASMFFADQLSYLYILLPLFILLLPVLFFPATAAMFASVRDWVMAKEKTGLIISYWTYYRENYKKGLLGGLFLTAVWGVWAVDYYYFSEKNIILMFAFVIIGVVLFVYTINFFSVIAHYNMSLRAILKNTLLITIGSPLLFITVMIGSGIIFLMSSRVWFLMPFFSWSILAFISFSAFYRLYLKLTTGNS
ncbi:YesL family protein [Oceanobacillus massiliensis]|uniref:YesL family protein n=1 Tax=Oceanobacillus massiliensis TaxID=1465765 RepID=UPI000310F8AF|nr:DUF624 domain-containing protein [Oceanobacillus massiliensis]